MDIETTAALRRRIIEEAMASFRPDVVLVDHQPAGALGELRPILERKRERPAQGPRFILGLRDILDEPANVQQAWARLGVEELWPLYEAILVYGSPDVYDTATAYGLEGHGPAVVYCNYVATPIAVAEVRPSISVLVMGGGRGDTLPLADALLDVFPSLGPEMELRGRILAGPNMPEDDYESLRQRAQAFPIRVSHFFEDATAWLSRSSVVITRAGYNSLCEVLTLRKKAIVIPRSEPGSEQRMRSRLFAERGLVAELDPVTFTPAQLGAKLIELLRRDLLPDPAALPPLNGAENVAEVLLNGR
jgi:predicted glycosyltransferase